MAVRMFSLTLLYYNTIIISTVCIIEMKVINKPFSLQLEERGRGSDGKKDKHEWYYRPRYNSGDGASISK
jgi:hypothetical protein